jgi:AraC-like DNA-binding protein
MPALNIDRGVSISHFDLEQLAEEERFSVWKDSISVVFDVTLDPAIDPRQFSCKLTTYHLGTQLLMETLNPKQVFRRTSRLIAKDGLDHFVIQLIRRGRNLGHFRGESIDARPGDIMLLDFGQPSELQIDDQESLTLFVPRPVLEQHLNSPERFHGRILRRQSPLALLLAEHLKTLRDAATLAASPQDISAMTNGVVSLAAHYFGQIAPQEESEELETALWPAIRRYVCQHCTDPDLNPDKLAAHFHVSRARLYRMFKTHGGVAHFIQQQKLSWALRQLLDPATCHRQISEIAHQAGFVNQSHFSRQFREAFGVSPIEVRHGKPNSCSSVPASSVIVDRSYEEWIRSLGHAPIR